MSMNFTAEMLRQHGQPGNARQLQERVLQTSMQVLGEDHPHTLTSMTNLASTLSDLGNHTAALQLHRRVLEVRSAYSARIIWTRCYRPTMSPLSFLPWGIAPRHGGRRSECWKRRSAR